MLLRSQRASGRCASTRSARRLGFIFEFAVAAGDYRNFRSRRRVLPHLSINGNEHLHHLFETLIPPHPNQVKYCRFCYFQQHTSAMAAGGLHQKSIVSSVGELSESGCAAVKLGLGTCYFVVSEELPNTKFRPILSDFWELVRCVPSQSTTTMWTCYIIVSEELPNTKFHPFLDFYELVRCVHSQSTTTMPVNCVYLFPYVMHKQQNETGSCLLWIQYFTTLSTEWPMPSDVTNSWGRLPTQCWPTKGQVFTLGRLPECVGLYRR